MTQTAVAVLTVAVIAGPAFGQADAPPSPAEERSVYETLAERSDLGNVVQSAKMRFHAGTRSLKQAEKLAEKAAVADTDEKRQRFEEKAGKACRRATQEFAEAITFDKELIEAYAGLGQALRMLEEHQQALQVHARALSMSPDDPDNFQGWAESLLALDMLGDATTAYSSFATEKPEQAEVLMGEMKRWLERHRADPGELDPGDVERLAAWIDENEATSG